MKKLSESLRKHAKIIIDFEKKKMLPLTKKELKSHQDATVCCICQKIIKKFTKDKKHRKFRDHYHYTVKYRTTAHSICNLSLMYPTKLLKLFTTNKTMIISLL